MRDIPLSDIMKTEKISKQLLRSRCKHFGIVPEIKKVDGYSWPVSCISKEEKNKVLLICEDLSQYISIDNLIKNIGCSMSYIDHNPTEFRYFIVNGKKKRYFTLNEYQVLKIKFIGIQAPKNVLSNRAIGRYQRLTLSGGI